MSETLPVKGVYLSQDFDLADFYGSAMAPHADEFVVLPPDAIEKPAEIRFAFCWEPGHDAFRPYADLAFAIAAGAGVDGLLAHPGLSPELPVCRIRDPDQAKQMAGFALHEVLHVERCFDRMAEHAARGIWQPLPTRVPREVTVAVLGAGSMGTAVVCAAAAVGFSVRVACRTPPAVPLSGIAYFTGAEAVAEAATGADYLINVLPLTEATRGILDRALFARMARSGWLIQIGRGEHLVEPDLIAALDAKDLAGATLDVFAREPLPPEHPFWTDGRLRITPHIASNATPQAVAEQIVRSVREWRAGQPLGLAVDRERGY